MIQSCSTPYLLFMCPNAPPASIGYTTIHTSCLSLHCEPNNNAVTSDLLYMSEDSKPLRRHMELVNIIKDAATELALDEAQLLQSLPLSAESLPLPAGNQACNVGRRLLGPLLQPLPLVQRLLVSCDGDTRPSPLHQTMNCCTCKLQSPKLLQHQPLFLPCQHRVFHHGKATSQSQHRVFHHGKATSQIRQIRHRTQRRVDNWKSPSMRWRSEGSRGKPWKWCSSPDFVVVLLCCFSRFTMTYLLVVSNMNFIFP